jgi:nitrogenase molybdenum-iron protein NifN
VVGDLEDAERLNDHYDLIVGNCHTEALAHRYGKGLVLRGFPNWETIGNQLRNDLLYEGGAYFLCETANAAGPPSGFGRRFWPGRGPDRPAS